ncbi:MAG: methyltransferase domain-containing protein, partial [Acetanaerobacterium sp.]
MRIRHKPWARPELAASPFFIDDPTLLKGNWHSAFTHPDRPLHLELGCGKGGFISQMALLHPDVNFIAVDIKSEMLGLAKRAVEDVFAKAQRVPDNVLLCAFDIERLSLILDPADV